MVAFVSIILALSLLGLIVYGLHRHQTLEVEYQVDRTMPLPPINGDERGKNDYTRQDFHPNSSQNQSRMRSKAPKTSGTSPQSGTIGTTSSAHPVDKISWQDQLAEAKNSGKFDLAYQICQQQFPLWSAYNQACITLRAQLKSNQLPAEQRDTLLLQLYRTAAIAELLHDKSENAESFKLPQLRGLDLTAIDKLDFPYQEIGYAQLRLIRKSDVKLMLAAWGRSKNHKYPREHHKGWWESQLAGLRG